VSGPVDFGGSPVTVSETEGLKVVKVRNYFFKNQFGIQFPLPKEVYSCDVAVIGFNPRILSNLWILIRRKIMKRAVILWGHGFSSRRSSSSVWKTIRIWMARLSDAVIFYSENGKASFTRFGIPDRKLFVAHNAIDVYGIHRLLHQNVVEGNEKRHVLYVGRLISTKRVDVLVEGFQKALDSLPVETKLIIIGDGPERARLAALVQDYRISDRVEFTGEILDDVELATFFQTGLVTVSPGYIGLSVIHSLAFGVPVLAADDEAHSPESEVLVQGRNCEFFKAGNADSLAGKLMIMLRHRERLVEMGRNGLHDVTRKYSLEKMTEAFLKAFLTVKPTSATTGWYSHVI
jgi:glycosyltransferase involved in cell wall biosynthesis